MINLEINNRITTIRDKHVENLTCLILCKLGLKLPKSCKCYICANNGRKPEKVISNATGTNRNIEDAVLDFYKEKFRKSKILVSKVLGSVPTELVKIFEKIRSELIIDVKAKHPTTIDSTIIELANKVEKKIFPYDYFNQKEVKRYNPYNLFIELDLKTCLYCNRNFVYVVQSRDKKHNHFKGTLDHYFPRDKYGMLSLSFFNLIPSCYSCNSSIKLEKEIKIDEYLHPYISSTELEERIFQADWVKGKLDLKIAISDTDSKNLKIINSLSFFKLLDVYQSHESELKDIQEIIQKYPSSYILELNNLMGSKYSRKDIYRIFFGAEYDSDKHHNRPLSKLKKDILNLDLD